MNKEQKAQVVEEVAAQIQGAGAVFAVDYRGISVPQAAELRTRLTEAGASFRVVKNTLTILAADKAGAEDLKELLEGPTAFTFVSEDGDPVLAAKALSTFRREHDVLAFKGGRMEGNVLSIDELQELARLPGREVLHAQVVGMVASPITGLVRGLNQLIAGFASQLQQIADQGLVDDGDEEAPEEEAPPAEEAPPTDEPGEGQPPAEVEEPDEEEEESSDGEEEESSDGEESQEETSDEPPAEGDQDKEE